MPCRPISSASFEDWDAVAESINVWTGCRGSKGPLPAASKRGNVMFGESGNRLAGWSWRLAPYGYHGLFATTLPFSHT